MGRITGTDVCRYCALITLIVFLLIPAVSAYSPTLSGDRNIGQEYRFTVRNVTTLDQTIIGSDVTYRWKVYDYLILGDCLTYWSVDWGRWLTQYADPGKKYMAIWVRSEMDGKTSWYGWGSDRFKLWIWGNTSISNMTFPLQDLPIEYKSDRYRPAVIAELQNRTGHTGDLLIRDWYGWKDDIELDRQEPGPSAAWDGIILYQIPEIAKADDIRVYGYSWYGYGVWYLVPKDQLVQVRPTKTPRPQVTVTETPIVRGVKPKPTVRVR